MRKTTWVLLAVVALALIGGGVFFFRESSNREKILGGASDAPKVKGQITVAGDNYLGYWFITSPEFIRNLRSKGYLLNWVNDGGKYDERHKNFADGKYDIIVLPVNSYLFHGKDYSYPGVITAVISDSKGADSVLAYKSRIVNGANREPTVNDLDNPNLKIAITPDSPSSFLLNTAVVHFDLKNLKAQKNWRVETDGGSSEAYEKFAKREVDAAVLWEPDVSKALALQDVVSVFGSDQISGMIVDVFVANRKIMLENPDVVLIFFQSYFETLAFYSDNREQMLKEMEKSAGLGSREAVEKAIKRIAWFDFRDNYDWFGIAPPGVTASNNREKLIDTIIQVREVMTEIGDLKTDPLKNNPYTITNSEILAKLYGKMRSDANIGAVMPVNIIFSALADNEWAGLRAIGTMRILPILFQSGTSTLTMDGKNTVDQVATALSQNYPQYRILIKGHTSPSSDEAANVALSQERADSVKRYYETVHGFNPNRIRAVGVGSKEPLPRMKGEGELSYRSRLPRVEFILLEDKR